MSKHTNNLINKWQSTEFESSTGKTEQFKKFVADFKKAIKEQTQEDFEVIGFNAGHFYISGFLKSKAAPDKFVYFSISDVRGFPGHWAKNVLIRTAKHEKDFSGGSNNYTDILNFGRNVNRLVR